MLERSDGMHRDTQSTSTAVFNTSSDNNLPFVISAWARGIEVRTHGNLHSVVSRTESLRSKSMQSECAEKVRRRRRQAFWG